MKQFKYMLKLCGIAFSLSKKVFLFTAIQIALTSAQPMITVILSARIVQHLIDRVEPKALIYTVIILVLANLGLGLLGAYLRGLPISISVHVPHTSEKAVVIQVGVVHELIY